MESSVVQDVPPHPVGAVAAAGRTERARLWLATHRAVVVIVVVAFVLRLAWVLWWHPSEPTIWHVSGDQYGYYHYGREIAAGNGYVHYLFGGPTAYYPIGYPAILAGLFFIVGHTPIPDDYMMALNVQNVVVGTASVLLAYLIGRTLFGERGGIAGAAILAVFPNVVFHVATVQLETMYIFWCLAALAIVVTHKWSRGLPSTRRLVAFGAVLGVSVLIRPFSIWFIAALFAGALVARVGLWRSVKVAAVPLAVVLLMMVPWTIRNAVRLHAFVPTSTNTGDTLCLDRFDGATGGFRWAEEGCADPELPEVERNTANTRMAINWVLDNPAREALQITRRGRLIFASDHDGVLVVNQLGDGQLMAAATQELWSDIADAAWVVVCVLATAGVVLLLVTRRRHRPETAIFLVSMASLIGVPLLLWGHPRFHLPFAPLFAILAGGAVSAAIGALGPHRDEQGDRGEQTEAVQPLEP